MSKTKSLAHDAIIKALDWSYDKAINGGVPGMDTAIELADSYLQKSGTLDEKVKSLILWQNTKSATIGFLTGLGGIIGGTVDVVATNTIGNIAYKLFIQEQNFKSNNDPEIIDMV
ncbi:hypothetical protein H9655_18560 [Cytobacillus sp. Sa5YUA1]|uniref:EcsC family protein n=1 Tax=Cytobacillus stercorigallinarum TaxID=2762240 RepID=A0ABR8QUD2_9BACI|nr:hypothetical protein [Cytobacillus stercorigallinarum]MBD7939044.1 hypothetical protein [Cytobacillus stercorigallinarum]